jgi:recombination protein RecT
MASLTTRPSGPPADQGQIISLLSRRDIKEQMALALPKHVTAERLARIALTCVRKDPKLASCDPVSFLGALMQAAALGLEPGINGSCFLIPYGRECTFVPGWKGVVDLVNRTGRATVWTGAVYEGDEFDYALGDRPFVTHRPGDESDPGKLTHVYAIGRVNGSECPIIEVWSMAKVARHRDAINKQAGKHYSFRHPEMYARKVALLQVVKYLPASVEVHQVMELNEQAERGYRQDTPLSHLIAAPEPARAVLPAAATTEVPPLSEQQLQTIHRAAELRLNPVGLRAFEVVIGDPATIPADQFGDVMATLQDDAAVDGLNANRDPVTSEAYLSEDELQTILAAAPAEPAPAAEKATPIRRSVGAA